MAEKRFSELTTAGAMTGAELLAMSQETLGSLLSVKSTLQNIANWFAVNSQYASALDTTDKTLCGAINELKQLISLIPQFSIEVVNTLPVSDISETTIYLVPNSDPEQGNYYEEYIYVNNAWELVGTTEVDLSAYYTKLEVDGLLSAKANSSDVTTALALKEDKSSMNTDVTTIVVGLTNEQTTAPGNPVTLTTEQSGGAKTALVTFAPKQSGTGDPSPSNIRPISGWDALNLYQSGKNMFDKTDVMSGYKLTSSGGTTSGSSFFVSDYIYLPEGDYIVEKIVGTNNGYGLFTYDENKTKVRDLTPSGSTADKSFTIQIGEKYIRLSALLTRIDEVQLEIGSTATAYEPYHGQTHTATFPDTVYGGSYDFVSGKLTIDTGIITLNGTENWGETSGGAFYYVNSLMKTVVNGEGECDKFKVTNENNSIRLGIASGNANNRIYFTNNSVITSEQGMFTDLNAWKTWLQSNNITVTFPLATPTEITLPPDDVNLLKGLNTVWTDGDTVQVEYSELPNGNLGAVIDYIKKLEARVKALES